MALPATGGTWQQVLEPNLNPLNIRYSQVTHAIIRDYDPTGVFNLANPSVGLATVFTATGTAQLFTPFAADNVSIRQDLFVSSSGTNQGFYDFGLLKDDAQDWTLDETLTETPSAQFVRSVRNVITKLDDKIALVPLESSPLTDTLRFELPLSSGIPNLGTAGYGLARSNTDQGIERIITLISIDTNANLSALVFPRVITDKKGKSALQRKEPTSMPHTYTALPDPFTGYSMWVVRAGSAWLGAADFNFETQPPVAAPVTGLKANITVPTPADVISPVYTAKTQLVVNGPLSTATIGTPITVSGGFTTFPITGLTASTVYNGVQVTATGSNLTVVSPLSNSFTSTAS